MGDWDDIDKLTADLDNVLNDFDIPGMNDGSKGSTATTTTSAPIAVASTTVTSVPSGGASGGATSFPRGGASGGATSFPSGGATSFPSGGATNFGATLGADLANGDNGASSGRTRGNLKKKPSVPGHASQFSSAASPPPATSTVNATPPAVTGNKLATAPKPSLGMPLRAGFSRPVAKGHAAAPQMPMPSGQMPAAPRGGGLNPTSPAQTAITSQASTPPSAFTRAPGQASPISATNGSATTANGSHPDYGFDNRFGPGSIWFHGMKKRALCEALIKKGPNGTYLVRESTTSRGDYVLSCKESERMSHYIITSKNFRVTIGDMHFKNIQLLVKNYQENILETTKLLYPVNYHTGEVVMGSAAKNEKKAKALFNFAGDDDEDLAFSKGDLLTIIDQSEPNWWRAKDKDGNAGVIPHNYVEIIKDEPSTAPSVPSSARPNARGMAVSTSAKSGNNAAKAIMTCHPNAYDPSALSFKKGDTVIITKKDSSGTWEGEANGKRGHFPCSYVQE